MGGYLGGSGGSTTKDRDSYGGKVDSGVVVEVEKCIVVLGE